MLLAREAGTRATSVARDLLAGGLRYSIYVERGGANVGNTSRITPEDGGGAVSMLLACVILATV